MDDRCDTGMFQGHIPLGCLWQFCF